MSHTYMCACVCKVTLGEFGRVFAPSVSGWLEQLLDPVGLGHS